MRLRRGYEPPPEGVNVQEADRKAEEAEESAAAQPVDKLLLVVHGIGQNLTGSNIASTVLSFQEHIPWVPEESSLQSVGGTHQVLGRGGGHSFGNNLTWFNIANSMSLFKDQIRIVSEESSLQSPIAPTGGPPHQGVGGGGARHRIDPHRLLTLPLQSSLVEHVILAPKEKAPAEASGDPQCKVGRWLGGKGGG